MAFRGWPDQALEFYEGLEADNTKTYWLANRSTYERSVKGPMEELLAELADDFEPTGGCSGAPATSASARTRRPTSSPAPPT